MITEICMNIAQHVYASMYIFVSTCPQKISISVPDVLYSHVNKFPSDSTHKLLQQDKQQLLVVLSGQYNIVWEKASISCPV